MSSDLQGPAARAAGLLSLAACAALLLALAATSRAEVAQEGNLHGSFNGGISPRKLPRTELAPVAVTMGGKITTTDRSVPPKLERIILAINSHGRLQNKGLPPAASASSTRSPPPKPKRACGDALVGHGNVTSRVSLPGQGAFASNARSPAPSTASSTASPRYWPRSPAERRCPSPT